MPNAVSLNIYRHQRNKNYIQVPRTDFKPAVRLTNAKGAVNQFTVWNHEPQRFPGGGNRESNLLLIQARKEFRRVNLSSYSNICTDIRSADQLRQSSKTLHHQ
tara:strand:- start:6748 stop:7056 length:309 start_codon:yes stop_codon:yes gene_type:complete